MSFWRLGGGLRLCCSRWSVDVRVVPPIPQRRSAFAFSTTTSADNMSTRNSDTTSTKQDDSFIRLSKLIAHHGTNIAMSRKEAERYIQEGDVTVAGQVVTSPHMLVDWRDGKVNAVKVGGKLLRVRQSKPDTKVWIVHKLAGEVVSEKDPHGRPSLLERIRSLGGGNSNVSHHAGRRLHLKTIGRLDMSTEGLILVTNNGTYAREMELPSNRVHRTYRVRVHGKLSQYKLKAMRSGLTIGNTRYSGMKVQIEKTRKRASTNTWLRITCTEGKNRQIRNVLNHLGLNVTRLIRVSYGDYQLESIPTGMALEVPVKPLKQQRHVGLLAGEKLRRTNQAARRRKQQLVPDEAAPVQWVKHL